MRRILAALAVSLTVAATAVAAPPPDASWRLSYWQSQPQVEQQDGVTNRTRCVWDVDDVTKWEAARMLLLARPMTYDYPFRVS